MDLRCKLFHSLDLALQTLLIWRFNHYNVKAEPEIWIFVSRDNHYSNLVALAFESLA